MRDPGAGFDEVGFYVTVAPTELGRKLHGAGGLRWRRELCAAYAFYWLELQAGKHRQASQLEFEFGRLDRRAFERDQLLLKRRVDGRDLQVLSCIFSGAHSCSCW
jgi:hypothetical protein